MSKEIRFTVDDDQFERLDELKKRHGLTWKGLLLRGADLIESNDTQ